MLPQVMLKLNINFEHSVEFFSNGNYRGWHCNLDLRLGHWSIHKWPSPM